MTNITHNHDDTFKKRAYLALVGIAVIGVVLGVGAIGFYFYNSATFPSDGEIIVEVHPSLVEVPSGGKTPVTVKLKQKSVSIAFDDELSMRQGTIASGDTIAFLLQEWLEPTGIQNFVESCKGVYGLHGIRAGQPYFIFHDEQGFCRFEYEIDLGKKLVVNRGEDGFSAVIEPIHYDISLVKVEGTITSSLFEAMSEIGEAPVLAVRLSDVFAWEINFIKSIQKGDTFTVLVEKRYRDGDFKGYGKLLAAEFINGGRRHTGYLYTTQHGAQYFNESGESLKRQFLKAPLSFTRISSKFTSRRLHPIHKTYKAHPAIDYAAPVGTPVKTVANGVAKFVGRGRGEGNYIVITHSSGYESMYLHLSRFASGLKKGQAVTQGQVIGYVGSTGYSTGPHLDFRVKKNGSYVNPESTLTPRSEPLSKVALPAFKAQRDTYQSLITDEKARKNYGTEKREGL